MHPVEETALKEIAGDPPKVDVKLLEAIAECVEAQRDGDGPEGLARGQKVRVEYDSGFPEGQDGIAIHDDEDEDENVLIVRPSRDRATEWLRILHELAHWLLMKAGMTHSHGDVWMLALALGAPESLVRRERPSCGIALAAASGLPAWAAFARLEMLDAT